MVCSCEDYFTDTTEMLAVNDDSCRYGLDVIDIVGNLGMGIPWGKTDNYYYYNNTDYVQSAQKFSMAVRWPCELRTYWQEELHPFVDVVRLWMNYGTLLNIIAGTVLNLISFKLFITKPFRNTSAGLYLAALAIFDTGNLLFNFLVGIGRRESYSFSSFFMTNEWLCRMHGFWIDLFELLSVWTIVAFSIERFEIVYCPWRRFSFQNGTRTVKILAIVVAFATLIAATKLFFTGFEGDSVFEYPGCPSGRQLCWANAVYINVALKTWVPVMLILLFNTLLVLQLRTSNKTGGKILGATTLTSLQRENPTRMLLAVSVAYILLVLPLGIVLSVELYWAKYIPNLPSVDDPVKMHLYVEWMKVKLLLKYIRILFFYMNEFNFVVNFFLYCMTGQRFRKQLREWITESSWPSFGNKTPPSATVSK